uniref:Bm11769 n=1 Tax=Brugia malayi TaxID=6279 RepID=A0A1I9GA89_BRUMA|nr:Bm11769 [Brugia malayi]
MRICLCECLQVPVEPRSWSYRCLPASGCGCWEEDSDPLREQNDSCGPLHPDGLGCWWESVDSCCLPSRQIPPRAGPPTLCTPGGLSAQGTWLVSTCFPPDDVQESEKALVPVAFSVTGFDLWDFSVESQLTAGGTRWISSSGFSLKLTLKLDQAGSRNLPLFTVAHRECTLGCWLDSPEHRTKTVHSHSRRGLPVSASKAHFLTPAV